MRQKICVLYISQHHSRAYGLCIRGICICILFHSQHACIHDKIWRLKGTQFLWVNVNLKQEYLIWSEFNRYLPNDCTPPAYVCTRIACIPSIFPYLGCTYEDINVCLFWYFGFKWHKITVNVVLYIIIYIIKSYGMVMIILYNDIHVHSIVYTACWAMSIPPA